MAGASVVDFADYTGCVRIENGTTEVILGHHAGGRVLSYKLNGVEAIFLDPAHYGWVDGPDKKRADLSGGRFDIGPEHTIGCRDVASVVYADDCQYVR